MYDNYIFDLYGTLADIHTNEKSLPVEEHGAVHVSSGRFL